jgi:hypothetical protein
MGLFEFLILVVVVVILVGLAVAAIGYFSPGHPAIIDKCLWFLAALIILWQLAQATGILGHDPRIPHF